MEKKRNQEIVKLIHYLEAQKNLKILLYNPFHKYTGNNLFRFYLTKLITIFEKNVWIYDDYNNNINTNTNINRINPLIPLKILQYDCDQLFDLKKCREKNFFPIFSFIISLKFGKINAIDLINNGEVKDENGDIDDIFLFDLKERIISFFKTRKCSDKQFIDFYINRYNHISENTLNFEDIYLFIIKMINHNANLREKQFAFQNDNKKLILELQKYDHVNNIEKNISKNNKFSFKKRNKELNIIRY